MLTCLCRFGTGLVCCSSVILAAHNQSSFDVASIKPTKTQNAAVIYFRPGGRFVAVNVTLRGLIQRAYQLQETSDRLVGGPNWIGSDRFDVQAKAEGNPAPTEMQLMVRALLADRFKLVMHTEERVLPIYELIVAPVEKGGSSLRASSDADCITPSPDTLSVPFDRRRPTCGVLFSPTGYWTGRRVTIDTVANVLTRVVGRPVVNRTQLAGTFDLDLQWTDVSMLLSPNPSDPPPIADGPSLFMALRDQLGLELRSTKGPLRVYVIDRVERPTED